MPQLKNRQYLEFEKPLKELYEQIEQLTITQDKSDTDMSSALGLLEEKITETKKGITQNLTPWQRVQMSRHPDRPTH